jgi:hypothetical protein
MIAPGQNAILAQPHAGTRCARLRPSTTHDLRSFGSDVNLADAPRDVISDGDDADDRSATRAPLARAGYNDATRP